jgi:hypothetical protein
MTEPKKKKGKKKKDKGTAKPITQSWHEFGKEDAIANELPTAPSEVRSPSQRQAFPSRPHRASHSGPRPVSEAEQATDWRSTMEPTARPMISERPMTAPSSERAFDQDWRAGNKVTRAPVRVARDTESDWRMGTQPTKKPVKPVKPKPTRDYNRSWRRLG